MESGSSPLRVTKPRSELARRRPPRQPTNLVAVARRRLPILAQNPAIRRFQGIVHASGRVRNRRKACHGVERQRVEEAAAVCCVNGRGRPAGAGDRSQKEARGESQTRKTTRLKSPGHPNLLSRKRGNCCEVPVPDGGGRYDQAGGPREAEADQRVTTCVACVRGSGGTMKPRGPTGATVVESRPITADAVNHTAPSEPPVMPAGKKPGPRHRDFRDFSRHRDAPDLDRWIGEPHVAIESRTRCHSEGFPASAQRTRQRFRRG